MNWVSEIWQSIYEWWTQRASVGIIEWLHTAGRSILTSVLILVVGLWAGRVICRIITKALKKSKTDKGIAGFISSCLNFILKVVVVIAAIAALGVNISSIITALGAVGITIGLAMQDSLANFVSGILILYNKPFVIGDFVEIDGSSGSVKSIELMHTVLITPENKELLFPNSLIASHKIINYTGLDARRLDMQFPVAYGSDIAKVKESLSEVCEKSVYRIPTAAAPVIGIREYGSSAILFDIRMWINANAYWDAYYDTQEKVLEKFAQNGITIPFEQVDVHIKNS